MEFMILDNSGSAVASFADELLAHATMHAIVAVEPDAADHVVLLAYGDDGMPVGEAATVWEIPAPFTVEPSQFVQSSRTRTVTTILRTQTHFVGNLMNAWPARIAAEPAAA